MKKYISILVLSVLMLICSCTEYTPEHQPSVYTPSNRVIEIGKFKIDVPGRWERFYFHEGDTMIAGITDKDDTLLFTYGDVQYEETEEYALRTVSGSATISGFRGQISIPEKDDGGQLLLVVKDIEKEKSLIIESRGVQNFNRMSNILSTLNMQNGKGKTFIPTREQIFREFYSSGSEGAKIFSRNCASCHHPLKKSAGPALTEVVKCRSVEWMYQFLTDEKYVPNDSMSRVFVKEYGFRCFKFPQLKKKEVVQLRRYLFGQESRIYICQ